MRIVAGKHKGLILKDFEYGGIRPTLDRVRENIFNKIQFDVQNSVVLDLFGGTGAVSLEFISRGAKSVITGDVSEDALKLIKLNFHKAKETPNLMQGDFKETLKKLQGQKFDFIYLDPPFATNFGEIALKNIARYDLLKFDGTIIFEHGLGLEYKMPNIYYLEDERKYGQTSVSYIKAYHD